MFYRQISFKKKCLQNVYYNITFNLNKSEEYLEFLTFIFDIKKTFMNLSIQNPRQANLNGNTYPSLLKTVRKIRYCVVKNFYSKIISLKKNDRLIYSFGKMLIYKNKIFKEAFLLSVYFSLYVNKLLANLQLHKIQYFGKLLKINPNNSIFIHSDLINISNTLIVNNKLMIITYYDKKIFSFIKFSYLIQLLFPPKSYYMLIN